MKDMPKNDNRIEFSEYYDGNQRRIERERVEQGSSLIIDFSDYYEGNPFRIPLRHINLLLCAWAMLRRLVLSRLKMKPCYDNTIEASPLYDENE